MAGALFCICSTFSSSVMRETRSAARFSGDRMGSRYGALAGCCPKDAAHSARKAIADKVDLNFQSPICIRGSLLPRGIPIVSELADGGRRTRIAQPAADEQPAPRHTSSVGRLLDPIERLAAAQYQTERH